ncbi:MAG: flavin reductase family protein [Promethearchaeota archaeon]
MFQQIKPKDLTDNSFQLFYKDWTLIAAGNLDKYNMMTASWGGVGNLWNKRVVFIFIRPSRYTYEFTEASDVFSLNFFDEEYRSMLNLYGSKSGRDIDKMMQPGLTPREDHGSVYFEEARLVFVCKKIYYQDLLPAHFLGGGIASHYTGQEDYHRMYIGEILSVFKKS